MEQKEIIDQSPIANELASKIKYNFFEFFLVKPLDPIKVTKEFSKPVATGKPTKDENGIEALDFDKVETEVKEVDSDYRKGVVIKRPMFLDTKEGSTVPFHDINVGDVVLFRDAAGLRFDLIKDSRLIRPFEVIGIEK